MAVTFNFYDVFTFDAFKATYDFPMMAPSLALLDNTYTPAPDTDDLFDDVNASEIVDGSYTAGGLVLTGGAWTLITASNLSQYTADDVVFTALTGINIRYGVLYYNFGLPSNSKLICYLDFGADLNPVAQDLTISWAGGVVFELGY